MGTNDAGEQLTAAKEEVVRLEQQLLALPQLTDEEILAVAGCLDAIRRDLLTDWFNETPALESATKKIFARGDELILAARAGRRGEVRS